MDNFSQQNYSQQPYVGQPVSGQPAMSNMPPTPPAQINPVQPQPVTAPKKPKFSLDDHQKLMITIGAFSATLVAALIFGVAMFMKYNDASSDLEEKIDVLSEGGTQVYEPVSANRNCRIELFMQ